MAYKIAQMILRSFTLSFLVLGFFFSSESYDLTRIDHFVMLGICGSYTIVTLGLLLETGLQLNSDKFLEASFLIGGIALYLLCAILAFVDFYTAYEYRKEQTMSIGVVSMLSLIFYIVDIVLLLIH